MDHVDEAERLLARAAEESPESAALTLARAQVHATLALARATGPRTVTASAAGVVRDRPSDPPRPAAAVSPEAFERQLRAADGWWDSDRS